MKISKQFAEKGYVIAKQFFTLVEIEQITELVNPIYQQWLKANGEALIEQQLINMHSLTHLKYFPNHRSQRIKFFELISPEKLTDWMEGMFGQGIYFHNTQLFFNPAQNRRLPYWHRDLQYNPIEDAVQVKELKKMLMLHIRIPLVAEKGIELIPGTHQRWDYELERNVRLELNGHTHSEYLPGAILIELEPGDILLFSGQMIHRGNYQLNPIRKALDICVGKEHLLTSSFLDGNVLPNNEEIGFRIQLGKSTNSGGKLVFHQRFGLSVDRKAPIVV